MSPLSCGTCRTESRQRRLQRMPQTQTVSTNSSTIHLESILSKWRRKDTFTVRSLREGTRLVQMVDLCWWTSRTGTSLLWMEDFRCHSVQSFQMQIVSIVDSKTVDGAYGAWFSFSFFLVFAFVCDGHDAKLISRTHAHVYHAYRNDITCQVSPDVSAAVATAAAGGHVESFTFYFYFVMLTQHHPHTHAHTSVIAIQDFVCLRTKR